MADMIIIKPSSGDKATSIFSGTTSSDKRIASVEAGTMLKVIGTSGNFYTVEYDNGMENIARGGTGMTGTIIANPYIQMYDDYTKSNKIATVNNGTVCKIIDDSNQSIISIEAITTEGPRTGYVDAKYIYRDMEEDIAENNTPMLFRMPRTVNGGIDTGTVTASELNIRKGVGTSYDVVGTLKNGDSVTVYETKDGWHRIGTDQWVSGKHIKLTSGNSTRTGTVNVTSGHLFTREGPDKSYKDVGGLSKGASVIIHETKNGWHRVSIPDGASPAWGIATDVWVSAKYILEADTNPTASVSKSDAEEIKKTSDGDDWSTQTLESYDDVFSVGYTGNINEINDEYYRQLSDKYAYALGAPPKYNMDIDIQYNNNITSGIGRVMGKTIMSNPAILSICPGKVKMFPNLIGAEKDGVIDSLMAIAKDNDPSLFKKLSEQKSGLFSSRLYKFEADTAEYSKYLNALCRACAIMMNVGDELMPGTTTKLKHFDYSYWTIRKKYNAEAAAAADTDKSIFRNFWDGLVKTAKRLVTTATDDTTYINFFLNGAESNITETIQNSDADSPLASTFETISNAGTMINYFTGSGFDIRDGNVEEALDAVINSSGSTLGGLAELGNNFLQGGRVVLPKMVQGSTYDRTINCSMKFVSPYGDKKSVFLRCLVPICHLLAMSLPKQVADNMYTYPFLIRCAQVGQFNCDLGIIRNVQITKGGSDSTSYTIESVATEWDVEVEIAPLVNELMMTSTSHPWLMVKNENLLNYLSNFCGFDAMAYNLDTKYELAFAFVRNVMTDIPPSIENKISDSLFNLLNPFFTAL